MCISPVLKWNVSKFVATFAVDPIDTGVARDVMYGVDYLVEEGIADPERMGSMVRPGNLCRHISNDQH